MPRKKGVPLSKLLFFERNHAIKFVKCSKLPHTILSTTILKTEINKVSRIGPFLQKKVEYEFFARKQVIL